MGLTYQQRILIEGQMASALNKEGYVQRVSASGPDEELLSSEPQAAEREAASLVRELVEISGALKSGSADSQSVNSKLQEAILCALKHLNSEREFRALALTDDLTGLYNRRGFLAAATQQLKLAQRDSHQLLLFFADVDGLKQINDSHGHPEGDQALVHVAEALGQTFRDSDIVARMGGDEFAILAFKASARDQAAILNRLENSLARFNSRDAKYPLSVSVGVARFDPAHPVSLGELMAQADQAMYEQKSR